MSQRDLARHIGRTPTATLLMLRGERKMRLEDATEMARLFSVPLDEILEAAGIPQAGVKRKESVNIVGWIDGDSAVHLEGLRGDKRAPAPSWGVSKRLQALRYQTNGTAIEGLNSALVYFNETEGPISIDDLNRLAVIEIEPLGQTPKGPKGSKSHGPIFVGSLKRAGSGGFRKFDIFSAAGTLLKAEVAVRSVFPIVWIKI